MSPRRGRFRRKELPAELVPVADAFAAVLAELEPAKTTLAEVLPTNRLPGRSLVDALFDFENALARARELMGGWRTPEVEDVWRHCADGIDLAIERARRLRREAPDLGGFEGILGIVQDLLDPLDPFEGAAIRFRELRVRPS